MSAAIGVVVGALVGGLAGHFGTKSMLRHSDLGVTGAAAAAGALFGGALLASPASAASGASATAGGSAGNFYQLSAGADFNASMKIGDQLQLIAPTGLSIASVTSNGSDAVTDQGNYTYQGAKLGGAVLTVKLSDGSSHRIKIEITG